MEFIDEALAAYAEKHSAPENELLKKISRETWSQVLMPRMLSGHLQGRVLSMFSRMIQPLNILEIGTYTGYSAICMAEGLRANGTLVTIDINDELETRVRGYFKETNNPDQFDYRIGDALDIIPELETNFDLVFIDADKVNYLRYFELILEKVRPGGFILADNVLWSGKILDNKEKMDEDTKALFEFNEAVKNDSRVETLLLPVRDGIMVMQKKHI